MPRSVTIVTPENITVTYQLAGVASRFLAFIIDLLIQFAIYLAAMLCLRLFNSSIGLFGVNASDLTYFVAYIVIFLIMFAYASVFEMAWGGRTPGKRLLGLRVIRDGGYPITLTASAIRNVLRVVDIGYLPAPPLLLFGLPGLVSIFLSPQYKRLGDYAAGTLVIVESGVSPFNVMRPATDMLPRSAELQSQLRNIDRISPEEYTMVRRYAERRATWEIRVQAALAERLARPLLAKMELNPEIAYQLQYAEWLEAIERRYSEENELL
ncbi:MAG TPA: RDD family protein [Chloroflexota bacterium]|nr:RDD family protein [Chloroflexota bacterium]